MTGSEPSVVVCSLNDPAGTNIRERLIERYDFQETDEVFDGSPVYARDEFKIACSHKDIVFVEGLEEHFGSSNYYFISRHVAESGKPSLTCHITGNFGPNTFGGRPSEISTYSPSLLKNCFLELISLRDEIPEKYELTLEATHHGPTSMKSPLIFVELGSTTEQWADVDAAGFVAQALFKSLHAQRKFPNLAIGIGGTHYPEKFGKFILKESEFAIGPIIPKHALEYFNKRMLAEMVSKSTETISHVLIDKKGLGPHKEKVLSVLKVSSSSLKLITL